MEIKVLRHTFSEDFTLGVMLLDNNFYGYTLEDTVRAPGVKVKDKTAIPSGTYDVVLEHSAHFDKVLPRIVGVPNFTGVLIHGGNTARDTKGCILVAKNNLSKDKDGLIQGSLSGNLTEILQKNGLTHKIKVVDCR